MQNLVWLLIRVVVLIAVVGLPNVPTSGQLVWADDHPAALTPEQKQQIDTLTEKVCQDKEQEFVNKGYDPECRPGTTNKLVFNLQGSMSDQMNQGKSPEDALTAAQNDPAYKQHPVNTDPIGYVQNTLNMPVDKTGQAGHAPGTAGATGTGNASSRRPGSPAPANNYAHLTPEAQRVLHELFGASVLDDSMSLTAKVRDPDLSASPLSLLRPARFGQVSDACAALAIGLARLEAEATSQTADAKSRAGG